VQQEIGVTKDVTED